MKKILCTLLVVVMCLTSAPLGVFLSLDFRAEATDYKVGDIVQFGSYPQSKVKDEALVAELNALTPEWEDWTSYGYYSGEDDYGTMLQGDWMRYTDIVYNGNKYRGVKFTQYRHAFQDVNGYYTNTVYWFKFESIDWRVLDPSTGLLMCETIIDSQPYSNTIYYNSSYSFIYAYFNDASYKNYASDYETSSIRKWLNDDFYNTAFTDREKEEISTTTLNNDGYYTSIGTTGYEALDSNETSDKIFLLSYNEARNSNYSFSSDCSDCDTARQAEGSDYAKSQGLHVSTFDSSYGYSTWLLRSSEFWSSGCCVVSGYGNLGGDNVNQTSVGVRPALRLNSISEEIIGPNQPNNPTEPDNPNNPDNPDNPDTPNNPDDPNKPNNPTEPDNPNNPDNPNEPNKPNEEPDDPEEDDNDEFYHPEVLEPRIDCYDTSVESYKNAFLGGDWNTFKITGEITNYDEYHNLENIWITIKSPDGNIIKFDSNEKNEVTFPLGRSIGTQKSSDFKCKAYVNRDYMPEGGTDNITLTCILNGDINGKKVEGIYTTFNVKVTNLSYKEDKPKRNKTVHELLEQMRDLVPAYESYYRQNIGYLVAGTGLTYDILAVESAYGLGDIDNGLNLANMAYDLSFYLAGITNPTPQEFGELFLDQLSANTEGEVDKIIDYVTNRLRSNRYFNGFIKWCCEEYGVDAGEYAKYSNHCPTDIIVTDEFGDVVLKIINDKIVICDDYVSAYVFEGNKTIYLPTSIEHEIEIIATDNGKMDYSVETVTKHGEKRVIEYKDVSLIKDKSYTATAPSDKSSKTDVYNLVTENGTVVKADNEQIVHTFDGSECINCDYDKADECDCKCHTDRPFAKFFFKIKLFFWKLFKKNPVCDCGMEHY